MPGPCEQVIDDRTRKKCGKPGRKSLALVDHDLCPEHTEYLRRALAAAWGVRLLEESPRRGGRDELQPSC